MKSIGMAAALICAACSSPAVVNDSETKKAAAAQPGDRSDPERESRLRRMYDQSDAALEFLDKGAVDAAIPLIDEVLQLRRELYGERDPEGTLNHIHSFAVRLYDYKRLAEAERLFAEVYRLRREVLGEQDFATLASMNSLAMVMYQRGKTLEAEPLFDKLIVLTRQEFGNRHPTVAIVLNNYAGFLQSAGRLSEAEPIQAEALRMDRDLWGERDQRIILPLSNYANLLTALERYSDAEPLFEEALGIARETVGEDDPGTLTTKLNYGNLLLNMGRAAEAEPVLLEVLQSRIEQFGEWDIRTKSGFSQYARALEALDRFEEAEPLRRQAYLIAARVLGPDHPDALNAQWSDILASVRAGRPDQVIVAMRQMSDAYRRRASALQSGGLGGADQRRRELATQQAVERLFADVLWEGQKIEEEFGSRIPEAARASRPELPEFEKLPPNTLSHLFEVRKLEALEAIQFASTGSTSDSMIEAAAARFALQQGLQDLVQERKALSERWKSYESILLEAQVGDQGLVGTRNTLRSEISRMEARIEEIDSRLVTAAPQYLAILNQDLVSSFGVRTSGPLGRLSLQYDDALSEEATRCAAEFSQNMTSGRQRLQQLRLCLLRSVLSADEAVLFLLPTERGTHAMAVTREDISWVRSDSNEDAITDLVEEFRLGLEIQAGDAFLPVFDFGLAHKLYSDLIAPVEDALEGKSRVYVIADGAFSRLPLATLITNPIAADVDSDDPEVLRHADWLADRYALVQLPSLQSLVYIRSFGIDEEGNNEAGFAGFGAPLLQGEARLRGARSATIDAVDASALLSGLRGSSGMPLMNPEALRKLAALPGTRTELEQVRSALGAPRDAVYLGERMTEPTIRNADLSRTRILHLATHGFTSEESGARAEPGLVFTPPSQARAEDDGYLAASEVVGLNLTLAEWVILSACNTASPSGKAGETGLSGLAQAFFYAGAESLLVSHWPVFDDIAPLLTVEALKRSEAGQPRAEALQAAMREIRMNPELDAAHPAVWAPFTLVGEGQ